MPLSNLRFVSAGLLGMMTACGTTPTSAPVQMIGTDDPRVDGGGVDAGEPDAADAGSDAFAPAPHAPLPVVSSAGGPVIGALDLVTVTFAGDPNGAMIDEYAGWIVGSTWLETVGKEYGVGKGTHSGKVVLSQPAPATATNADTEALFQKLVTEGTLPKPAANTLFAILYPSTTTISDFADRPNCIPGADGLGTLGGYHWETQAGATKFPFVVLPTCSTTKDAKIYLQVSASHEIIEAATDPFPVTAPGFALADATSGWTSLDGEVGDLCEGLAWGNDKGHWTQPSWSASSAAKGSYPCLPAAPGPYYNADLVPSAVQHVKAGASVKLAVHGWSSAPMVDWALEAFGDGDFQPKLALSRSTMNNGGQATLDVTVPSGTPAGATATVFLLSTRDAAAHDINYWPTSIVVAP